jgi:hypothetical protein
MLLPRPWPSLPRGMQSYMEELIQLLEWPSVDSWGVVGFLPGQLVEAELGSGGVFSETEVDSGRGGVPSQG